MKTNNTDIIKKGEAVLLKYPNLSALDFVIHSASTRFGGVSEIEHFASMNLGLSTDDSVESIKTNWDLFCNASGIKATNTVCANQKHGDNILCATEKDRGKGIIYERDYDNIDALITNCPEVALCVFSADCIPVLLADAEKKVVAAAHCGWKGTFLELARKTVLKMVEQYGCNPINIKAAIGAGIHSCCYEVDCVLYMRFKEKFSGVGCISNIGKYYLDLPEINRYVLKSTGVTDVFVSDICTGCNPDELFSHRASNGKRGLMVNMIQINRY